jgi:crotonobetainyl-CoA:carnitine CoA-transferase CaiB-like acyl-CoA transferase
MTDPPLRFSDSPAQITRLPPRFGEHGREILAELGLTDVEIEAVAAGGAVVLPES